MKELYRAKPKSRLEIRNLAHAFRKLLHLDGELYVPIVDVLESLYFIDKNYSLEILEDKEFDYGIHAETDIVNHCIKLRESVYEGAISGNGRDRMTIAHEIGHYLMLCLLGFSFARNFEDKMLKPFESPEWQATCFAAELLIDSRLVKTLDPNQIMEKCGVSLKAANYQYQILKKQVKNSKGGD